MDDGSKTKDYQEYLLSLSAEQRKRLAEQGLQLENGGDRVDRSNMNKSLLQIQQEKLEKLMERVDVPLEDEMREIREFRPARKIGPKLGGGQVREKSGNDYHKFKFVDKKKLKRENLQDLDAKQEMQRLEDEQQRLERIQKEEEATAKKRLKRQRKKEKKASSSQVAAKKVKAVLP